VGLRGDETVGLRHAGGSHSRLAGTPLDVNTGGSGAADAGGARHWKLQEGAFETKRSSVPGWVDAPCRSWQHCEVPRCREGAGRQATKGFSKPAAARMAARWHLPLRPHVTDQQPFGRLGGAGWVLPSVGATGPGLQGC
jgi:hypothetical protein